LRPNGKGEKARAVNMADGMCWSGGGVVDFNNTLGKQVGDTKTLITTFTDTIAGERMAYSTDKGRTWTVDDVLIRHHGRDPKPFWYEPGKHWNIIAWSASDSEREKFNLPKLDKGGHAIYKSKDFKTWKQSGFVNNFYECPEMFELPVDGDKDNTRWVVFGAASLYRVGQFDGNQFAADNPDAQDQKVFYGPVYAGQIFSNTPDDRKIYVAWAKVNTTTPDAAFSQGFTLPLELTLHTTDDGLKLFANPIEEFKQLRQDV
jgi:sucrose-6-phosphate hydrolase SacC (GH32 family)